MITIFLLLFISMPANATLWSNKVDTQDLQRIITELRIYDDPDLPYYNEIFRFYYSGYTGSEDLLYALNKKIEITQQVIKILDADIKKEEFGNLTYGRYILNAINEEELVEIGIKMGSPGQANGEYFSKLGKNLANWESQLSKLLLTKIIVATCTAMGAPALSIGISTLGLFCDLSIIGISINKLNEKWYEKAFWFYMQFRNKHNYDHIGAWESYAEPNVNHIFILFPEKQKKAKEAIEENFKSLWNKYGDHIVNNELDKNFKSQQRESLKILLLYALGAEPHPIITSPLKITPVPSYYVGDTINAEFTITNQGKLPIDFSVLTLGGRDPDNQVADFTHRQNITLEPFESYDYKGTLTINKVGDYHFFCTYQTPDGNWNTCVDLGSGLVDEDRTEDISVEEKEKPSIAPDISEELYIEWEKTFGGNKLDEPNFITQTKDGGYAITGWTISEGYPDTWIIKLDEQGNTLWEKTFGENEFGGADSIIQTKDGGYAVTGWTPSKKGCGNAWITKLDEQGNVLWKKTFGGNELDRADSIIQTKDGGYAVAGGTRLKGAEEWDWDVRIIKLKIGSTSTSAEQVTKEKLIIDSSLYHFEHSMPVPSGYLPVSVKGPADELALILTNPEGETDIRFISKRALIDNFETVKLHMGNAPLSEGPYILTVKTVTPEKIIYKKELWFTLPDVSIADAEFTYKITHLGGAYGYAGYYFLEIVSLTLINNGDLPAKRDTDARALITLDGKPENMTLLTRPYSISPYENRFYPPTYIPNGKNKVPLSGEEAMYGLKKGKYFVTITIPLMGGETISFKKALTIE